MLGITVRRIALLAALAAAFAFAPDRARAQLSPSVDLLDIGKERKTPAEQERLNEIDRNYQEAIKKVPPQQKKAADPWADMRQNSSSAKQGQR